MSTLMSTLMSALMSTLMSALMSSLVLRAAPPSKCCVVPCFLSTLSESEASSKEADVDTSSDSAEGRMPFGSDASAVGRRPSSSASSGWESCDTRRGRVSNVGRA